MRLAVVQFLLSFVAAGAGSATPQASVAPSRWAALPVVNYNTDDGFGLGATGSYFWHRPGVKPYVAAVTAQVFVTTKGLHSHRVRFDAPRIAGNSGRLQVDTGLFALASANYCGVGHDVVCDLAAANRAVADSGLSGDAAEEAAATYFKLRYVRPYARLAWRAMWLSALHLEWFASWRASYYMPGTLSVAAPYPHSLYAQRFSAGERGIVSVLQVGLLIDKRDNEPAPTHGTFVEASVRASHSLWAGEYGFFGANFTARGYLSPTNGWVLAGRFVADVVQGDLPIGELSRVGGTRFYAAYGGVYSGRGIRVARYIDNVKAFVQLESRWTPLNLRAWGRTLDLGIVGFVDAGVVGPAVTALASRLTRPRIGAGLGFRGALSRNFVVRADIGVSPLEDWGPRLYLALGHVF